MPGRPGQLLEEDPMKKISGLFILMVALAAMVWVGFAQNADTAKDPVCGMSVAKATAKWTSDFKGTTYYFCSEGCKTEFAKNPDKYLASGAGLKVVEGMPLMMHGQMAAGAEKGCQGECPMMAKDVEKKIENIKDGVVITLTSKNPESVKKMQEHAAMMKSGQGSMMKAPSSDKTSAPGAGGPKAGCGKGCCEKK
jgi:YHS domain-containing protein